MKKAIKIINHICILFSLIHYFIYLELLFWFNRKKGVCKFSIQNNFSINSSLWFFSTALWITAVKEDEKKSTWKWIISKTMYSRIADAWFFHHCSVDIENEKINVTWECGGCYHYMMVNKCVAGIFSYAFFIY